MNSTNTENQNMESDETAAVVQPTTMSVLSSEDSNGVFGLKKAPKRHYTKRKERKVVYSLDKPPRKKAKKRNLKIPDWNELSALFHLSSSEAAKKLNISISKLYEVIKLYNMSGWPTKKTPCLNFVLFFYLFILWIKLFGFILAMKMFTVNQF